MTLKNNTCPMGFNCQLMCGEFITPLNNKFCANFPSCLTLTEPRSLQPLKFNTLPAEDLEKYYNIGLETEFEEFCDELLLAGQASQFSIVSFESHLSSDEKKSLQQAGFYEPVPLTERKFYERLINLLNKHEND